MRNDNIFVAGPQAAGESFFGRHRELEQLGRLLYGGFPSHGLSLIGPTRIGKSSLISRVLSENRGKPGILTIKMCLAEHSTAFDFWLGFAAALEDQLRLQDRLDPELQGRFQTLGSLEPNGYWYMRAEVQLKGILRATNAMGLRVLWVIDEFDAAAQVLETTNHFQLIRTFSSESGEYNTTTVLVSRSPLAQIERRADGVSSFHGVFREMILQGFNEDDFNEYLGALSEYDIFLPAEALARLRRYAGSSPYLLCMFAQSLVERAQQGKPADEAAVAEIFHQRLHEINAYYGDLVRRFENDQQLEALLGAVLGPRTRAQERGIQALMNMGYLQQDENGVCYALSEDFTTYLRLQQSTLPLYDTIFRAEKKLRSMVGREYPLLLQLRYDGRLSQTEQVALWQQKGCTIEKGYLMGTLYPYCRNMSSWMDRPALLDVLPLGYVVGCITRDWAGRFGKYFPGESRTGWTDRLEQLHQVRNPLMHAHIEWIPEEVLSQVQDTCERIAALAD